MNLSNSIRCKNSQKIGTKSRENKKKIMAESSRHQPLENQHQSIIRGDGKKSPRKQQRARSALGWGEGKHDAGDPSRHNTAR
jgi:hypothetical protein